MDQCRLTIRVIGYNKKSFKPNKWGLKDEYGDWVANKSNTKQLEFASINAAMRAHDRLCEH